MANGQTIGKPALAVATQSVMKCREELTPIGLLPVAIRLVSYSVACTALDFQEKDLLNVTPSSNYIHCMYVRIPYSIGLAAG
jgi:hypothetical protein